MLLCRSSWISVRARSRMTSFFSCLCSTAGAAGAADALAAPASAGPQACAISSAYSLYFTTSFAMTSSM
eukprot:15200409-Alexandrium_andersonii.AAC.1